VGSFRNFLSARVGAAVPRLLFSGLLQFAERTVRTFVDAVETGLVTGGERNAREPSTRRRKAKAI